ncbi:MAG: hypothetical protein JW720_16240 [Sedimentisphaerales bacterium]|nr:hypothetical protein [Sedimentisphaerales bacterium]
MLRGILVTIVSVVLCAASLGGCGKKSDQADQVKTEAELKTQAEKEITEENMDDELAKIEEEIEADVQAEP